MTSSRARGEMHSNAGGMKSRAVMVSAVRQNLKESKLRRAGSSDGEAVAGLPREYCGSPAFVDQIVSLRL